MTDDTTEKLREIMRQCLADVRDPGFNNNVGMLLRGGVSAGMIWSTTDQDWIGAPDYENQVNAAMGLIGHSWWLVSVGEDRTNIGHVGDYHEPKGTWTAALQYALVGGIRLTVGTGKNPALAIVAACAFVKIGYLEDRWSFPSKPRDYRVFDTPIPQERMAEFAKWKNCYTPHDNGENYDLYGAFLADLMPDDFGHWPDTFKKPNHPTFSVESIYAKHYPRLAGRWNGDRWVSPYRAGER